MSGDFLKRRTWTKSLTIAMCFAIVAVVLGYLIQESPAETDRKYLQSTAGPVLFDHGEHSEIADSCAVCHHTLYGSEQAITCESCHGEEMGADEFSHTELKEIHGTDCSQCHQQEVEDEQALSCRECHPGVQQNTTAVIACSECHDDTYTPDIMEHDEYMEVEDHSCTGCHAPSSLSDVYHANCSDCHLENSPEKFSQADGEVNCSACHLQQ